MDPAQIEANINLEKALRRANLLTAAAQVSQNITQIMDMAELLPKTVDIICEAYGFYYAGVFLIDEAGEFAVLRAGRGEPGRIMIENHHKLAVGGNSMIGACTGFNQARISLDVDTEKIWYPNPVLPDTRSEMALPLAIGNRVIGAVTVQSVEPAAFSDEDVSSLQAMANQLAIALDNARQRRELEEAHAELVRVKTFEAIATATGDAIHWIGNKAEPISPSVKRVRYDLQLLISAAAKMLQQAGVAAVSATSPGHKQGSLPSGQAAVSPLHNSPLAQLLLQEAATIEQNNPELAQEADKLIGLPLDKLAKHLSIESIVEDLHIIDSAAGLIMRVKEDLIGPAREQAPRPTMAADVLQDAVHSLGLPPDLVTVAMPANLPLVVADPMQLHRVFINLLKNAQEALESQPKPHIKLAAQPDSIGDFVEISVTDNGVGIAAGEVDKIWGTFHTTKGVKGHAGLGLPACRLILEHIGGHISLVSQPGQGTTFTLSLPVYQEKESKTKLEPGKGNILLIDDNDGWRQFAEATLKAVGYKVTVAEGHDSASNYNPYDLIVVDDILAQRDSLTVLRAIAAVGATGKTIVVSSNPRVERTKVRMLLGIQNLLPKPYTQASLLSETKKALGATK